MDNILLKVGEFGLYQKCVFTLICLSTLFCGLYETMSVIFLNSPEHRCKIPGLENDTYDIHSAYQQNLVNNYIPPSTDDDTLDYDQCHLYSFDNNNVKFDNPSRPINASLVKCHEWVYSDSVFKETFTSKFNIVCDDTYLIPLVKSMYIVGKFVGACVFGNLSDAFIPESPRWLINKHRYQDAYMVIKRMAKLNRRKIESDLWENEGETKVSEPPGSVWQLFSSGMLLRTLVILFNWFTVYMTYYGLTLIAGNLAGNFYVNMLVSGLVEIPAHTMVLLLIGRVGRKTIYSLSLILGGCACASTIFPIVDNEIENQTIITTLAMIGKFGTSAAYSTLYLYSAELLPTAIRNAGMGACICTARIGGIVAPYIADSAALIGGMFGKVFPLGLFGVFSIIAGLSSLTLPETLNKTLPETMENSKLLGKSTYMSLGDNGSKDHKIPFYENNGYLSEEGLTRL